MKIRPIHENLDTSFVNLSALINYLRRRQFVGRVRFESSGYEADIHLLENNKISAREHDRIAGRQSEGEEAMRRLLFRAREPGGTIHVYQAAAENPATEKISESPREIKSFAPKAAPPPDQAAKPRANGNSNGHPKPLRAENKTATVKPSANRPDFPFALSNQVEARAREIQRPLAPEEWQTLLNLIAELLGAVDKTLAEANLNFSGALTKICEEIAADYPFLNPAAGIFVYANGKLTMRRQVSAKLFADGINESLRRFLEKLGSSPKFSEVHRATVQKILVLIHRRKPLYQKFFISPQLEKIIGA